MASSGPSDDLLATAAAVRTISAVQSISSCYSFFLSGIAGIFRTDGAPVTAEMLARMAAKIGYRGPDGEGQWKSEAVGLVHKALHITPESVGERQPLWNEAGTCCLVFDGRIDYRHELREILHRHGVSLRNDTDAELVLKAYEAFGEGCAAGLLGDFAFAIWDQVERRIFCARDILGCRPLFYFFDGNTFVFSSEFTAIFASGLVRREPNEGMVGEYLAVQITHREETLWRNVYRMLPAHWMVVGRSGVKKVRYWDVDPENAIRYRNRDEYAEHFLRLFKEAIQVRLRCRGTIGACLSGGLDSSSIVCAVEGLGLRQCGISGPLETFSNIFPDHPECDETRYISHVVERWGVPNHTVIPTLPDRGQSFQQAQCNADIPDYPNGSMSQKLRGYAKERGVRVLLSGFGGDEWLSASNFLYADLLRQGHLVSFVRHFRRKEKQPLFSKNFGSVIWLAAKQALPMAILKPYLTARQWWRGDPDPWSRWMQRDFARKINLRHRLAALAPHPRFASLSQIKMYYNLRIGSYIQSLEFEDRCMARWGIEQRHPFNDRRIIEFAFAIPPEEHWCNGYKTVLRRSFRDLLPEPIRTRQDKANFGHIFPVAMEKVNACEVFENSTIADRGWVRSEVLLNEYDKMRFLYLKNDNSYLESMWWLWMVYAMETWARTCLN